MKKFPPTLRRARAALPLVLALLLVLTCLGLMFEQTSTDYRDLQQKISTRVHTQADDAAARVQAIARQLQQAADQASALPSEADPMALEALRKLWARGVPGLQLAVERGAGAPLLSTDAQAFSRRRADLQRQRRALPAGQAASLADWALLPDGLLLFSYTFAGQDGLLVHVLLPKQTMEDSLRHALGTADDALAVMVGDRTLFRLPHVQDQAYLARAAAPRDAFGAMPGVFLKHSPFDGKQRVATERGRQEGGGMLRLVYSIAWDEYRANWRRSAAINAAIALVLVLGYLAFCLSYWRQRRQALALAHSARQLNDVLQHLPLAVLRAEPESGRIIDANPAMLEQFGALAGQGQPLQRLFPAGADWQAACAGPAEPVAMLTRAGERFIQLHRTDVGEANQTMLLTLADVTDSHLRQQQLHTAAYTDALTGLANRRRFGEEAARLVAEAERHGGALHVLALDLDHFKRVNDSHGHDVGDLVLQQAARLLQGALRGDDLAARVGGEEFVALLPGASQEQACATAERVRLAFANTPLALPGGGQLRQTVSIGVAAYAAGDGGIETALKLADEVLYRAKEDGRNRVAVHGLAAAAA